MAVNIEIRQFQNDNFGIYEEGKLAQAFNPTAGATPRGNDTIKIATLNGDNQYLLRWKLVKKLVLKDGTVQTLADSTNSFLELLYQTVFFCRSSNSTPVDLPVLQPFLEEVSPSKIPINSSRIVKLLGGNFDTNTIVTIDGSGVTLNSYVVESSECIILNVTSDSNFSTYNITAQNDSKTNFGNATIEVGKSWVDLRLGGDTLSIGSAVGNDIRHRDTVAATRDAQGLFFTGTNPWSTWAKIDSLAFNRGDNKTIEWIFSGPDNFMMIGIASDATNETSNSQFSQGETMAYFNSSTNFWGLYGNNGTVGSAGLQNVNTPITTNSILKIKFENDGSQGGQFTLFQLPSANDVDWDNESNVLQTFTIGGSLNPNETNLMPFIIPRSGGNQRFIAVKVD